MLKLKYKDNKRNKKSWPKPVVTLPKEEPTEVLTEEKEMPKKKRKFKRDTLKSISE